METALEVFLLRENNTLTELEGLASTSFSAFGGSRISPNLQRSRSDRGGGARRTQKWAGLGAAIELSEEFLDFIGH